MRLQAPWINNLVDGLPVRDIKTTHSAMTGLRRKLEGEADAEEQA